MTKRYCVALHGILSFLISSLSFFSSVDPVQQDNSIFKSFMSEEQEVVLSKCYRQQITAVLGGPGTGKSQLAARLAHLLVKRNRTADAFRQIRHDVYTTQLMLCAPNETSLDVVTGTGWVHIFKALVDLQIFSFFKALVDLLW